MRPPLIEAGQVFVVPESPSPRKTPPRRESNEESPGRRVSLAQVWGRAAPNGLPAENAAKPIWSRKNALCRAADSVLRSLRSPRSPVPFVLRRDRHKETHKPEVNQPSSITARQPENALPAISTHGGTETEHPASRPVWRYASNSRRDRTQDISTGTYDRREPSTTARITHQ